ncbi:MAG: hypothetical protein AAF346_00045 [Pseudomonadota bacterium]
MTKANNHPIVRDLRQLLDKHKIDGAVLVGVFSNGHPFSASAGRDVEKCNALGPVLQSEYVDIVKFEVDQILMDLSQTKKLEG